jgi:LmbE family N-acetylglucosaminyl deacetylase
MNKILIIAPHGDDEINLIGTIAEYFVKDKAEMLLLLVTNGDYIPKFEKKRHDETESVAKKMGFSRVIYLGYGDDPAFDERHTYQTSAPERHTSPGGYCCTYGVGQAVDYAFQTSGAHHSYNRDNVKDDMKACILQEQADMIICVDFDEHADHRMASVLFDEIMCEVLQCTDYRPIILKKYAYAGVWFGPDDYFCSPMRETFLTTDEYFPYSPAQEIRVNVSRKHYPVFYKKSPVYRLCEMYQSQYAWEHFTKIVNADALYFYRDCSNLALGSDIEVSSGRSEYLNDFKLIDTPIINRGKDEMIAQYGDYTWIPDQGDTERSVDLFFHKPATIREIHLHLPYQPEFRPTKIEIYAGDTHRTICAGSNICEIISFDTPMQNITQLRLIITEGTPGLCGIREIEVFDHRYEFPWDKVAIKKYNPKSLLRYRPGSTAVPKFSKKLNTLKMFLQYDLKKNGIKYYLLRLVQKLKR